MSTPRGRSRLVLLLVGAVVGSLAGVALAGFGRRRLDAVEVLGRSMAPQLHPGDRLLVESFTYARRPPVAGEVVLAADPREPSRELVKRVFAVDAASRTLELRGDAPETSTDSRAFGAIPAARVRWRVALRYWPPARFGRV
jgi:nickel-type superoxide dismutase maturation protease